ncbi:hypothetical protein NKG05_29490 [Oerskovia sp. M15]
MTAPAGDATAYDHDDVQTFLNSYGVALAAGDLDAIAASYAFPALVVTDEASLLISDAEVVRESFRGAAEGYRERGLVGAVAQIRSVGTTSAGLVWADVRWSYRDEWAARPTPKLSVPAAPRPGHVPDLRGRAGRPVGMTPTGC